MSYQYTIDNTVYDIDEQNTSIAYNTNLVDSVTFDPSDYYKNTFQNMPQSNSFVSTLNNIFEGKWGKTHAVPSDQYQIKKTDGTYTQLEFANPRSCPTPNRPDTKTSTCYTDWGDARWKADDGSTFYIRYNNSHIETRVDSGSWYAYDSTTSPIIYIDLVAGGGAGGGTKIQSSHIYGGSGGGGGASCSGIFDLSITGQLTINLGKGGTYNGGSHTPEAGGSSKLTFTKNSVTYSITLNGGSGAQPKSGNPGAGGTVNFNNLGYDSSNNALSIDTYKTKYQGEYNIGIRYLTWFYGKAGGKGGVVYTYRTGNNTIDSTSKGVGFAQADKLSNFPLSTYVELGLNGSGTDQNFGAQIAGQKTYADSSNQGSCQAGGGGGGATCLSNSRKSSNYDGRGGLGESIHYNRYRGETTYTNNCKAGDGCCVIHFNFHR